jgi:ComF family protein
MDWYDVATSLLLGSTCLGCDRPGRPWCGECMQDLEESIAPWAVAHEPPTIACCHYTGLVPEAIVGFKDRNVRSLGPLLADMLALAVDHLGEAGTLVPAPSSPAAVRRRGFDHTAELARRAGQRLGLPHRNMLRARRRKDQTGLSSRQRRRNLEGSMWVPASGHEAVIVVDDIRTSGATLAECGRALQDAGYQVLGNVVVASAHG